MQDVLDFRNGHIDDFAALPRNSSSIAADDMARRLNVASLHGHRNTLSVAASAGRG